MEIEKEESNVPPLLKVIEREEEKIQETEERLAVTETFIPKTEAPVVEEKKESKGRELPAFMRKLFKK